MSSRQRRLRRSALVPVTALAVVLTACAPGGGGGNEGSSDGDGSITIGVEAGSPWEAFYKEHAPEFTEETGIEVEILAVPHANMRQQFLSDAVSGEGAYDVYTVDQPWIPEFAEKGYLVDVTDRLADEDRDDFLPHTLDTVSYDGGLYGLPFMVHNLVLYYRTDLLAAAGIQNPPTTWEEYRDVAIRLTDPAAGVYGTIMPGKQDNEVSTRFQSYIQQAGGDIVGDDGAPTIDTPEARAAFDLMTGVQFQDRSSPEGLHDLTEIQGQFLEGKVAMALVWPYLYSLAQDPAQSKVAGNVAIAPAPGNPHQVATTFAWGFGISSASQNQDEAWEWLQWSTSAEMLEQISRDQTVPTPRQSVVDTLAADTSLTDAQRQTFQVFADSVAASTSMPMTPAYPQYQEAMAVAVSAVMSQGSDVDSALRTAQEAMDAAYEESGQ
ncbi:ABC transporter substrate-binding protein [Geodermatophilus sp. SYSU D00815]